MRHTASTTVAAITLAVCAGFGPASQRNVTPPALTIAEEWRVAPDAQNIRGAGVLAVTIDRRVVVAPLGGGGDLMEFDSTGKSLLWKMPVGGGRDQDIRSVQRVGFAGQTLWVSDRGFDQVALVDAHGKVTKSLARPSFVHPSFADKRKYPVFGRFDMLGLYADGTWLVRPGDEHSLVDTPEFDSTQTYLVRMAESGTIDRTIARVPADPVVSLRAPGRNAQFPVPFANRALWAVSSDGMRVATVVAALRGKDSATYRVTTVNERGDTMFAKVFAFTPQVVSKAMRDSAVANAGRFYNSGTFPNWRAEAEKRSESILTPVTAVLVGRDRTTWLLLRSAPADSLTRTWSVLDPRGEPVARVTMPRDVVIFAADLEHVWSIDKHGNDVRGIVRYKLVPAR